MASIEIKPVTRSDAAELIQANIESRSHHAPWMQPFTDAEGFEEWFAGLFTGPNVGLIARSIQSGGIVGVLGPSTIFGFFRHRCMISFRLVMRPIWCVTWCAT